jgi:hypothetical protein
MAVCQADYETRVLSALAAPPAPPPPVEQPWEDPLTAEDEALIDWSWEVYKAGDPVATVINDNQPGRTFIAEAEEHTPTIPVGTKLYLSPQPVPSRPAPPPPPVEREACPFCGGADVHRHNFSDEETDPNAGGSCYQCHGCGASGPIVFGDKESLEWSWDRRTASPLTGTATWVGDALASPAKEGESPTAATTDAGAAP